MLRYALFSPLVYLAGLYLFDFEVAIAMTISYYIGMFKGFFSN